MERLELLERLELFQELAPGFAVAGEAEFVVEIVFVVVFASVQVSED